eukprot:TRINITY_DN3186_c0_g1_i1.p1 TRINITY_DN3186_c0_g1~~TRINITY_DN3186_c0_g1_i1.p1  ORF type:complete len:142 (-),score=22.99 TRINITY_DN3186_c0_g1_i1:56-427(-)
MSDYRTSDANSTQARCGQTPPLNSFQQISDPLEDEYSEEDAAAISSLESLLALRPKAQIPHSEPLSSGPMRSNFDALPSYRSLPQEDMDCCADLNSQQEETEYMVRVVLNDKKSKEDIFVSRF